MKKQLKVMLKAAKLLWKACLMVIHIKILDVKCFIRERKSKGKFDVELMLLYDRINSLCEQGENLCKDALNMLEAEIISM